MQEGRHYEIRADFPQVDKAVVQGITGQYVVVYGAMTCTCPDHREGHRQCKHLSVCWTSWPSG